MGLQKQAHKTNLGWKGVTPSAQACKLYIMATQSQFWEPQLKCKESVEYYCTEMHMGVTCDWLLHMHGCHVKDKWHVKMKFCKGQGLAKASKCKARKLWEQIFLLQDAQGQLGLEERKAKNGEQGGRKCNLLYTAVRSMSPLVTSSYYL